MANPITWRNVNQPNFNPSNVLRMNATKQLGNAFESGSQRLIDQGEFNQDRNNDAFASKLAQYSNYDNLQGAKADLFAGIDGTNIDTTEALKSYNDYSSQLGQDEIFSLDRGQRQRDETDRAAVAGALDSLNQSWTADSASMTTDNIRDSQPILNLTPAQKAIAMPQALSSFGTTAEQTAAAKQTAEVKMKLLDSQLKREEDLAKQEAIAANSGDNSFSPNAKGTLSIMDYPDADKTDGDYLRQKNIVRQWDANDGKMKINGIWYTVPASIMETATQQAIARGENKLTNWLSLGNDDTDYDPKPFQNDILQLLRVKKDAGNEYGDSQ